MDNPVSLERKIVTVLFSDVVGFTSLSEQLDPEDVSTLQEAYFEAVRETVGRYGGRLEKFIGDAAMAVFGVPRARDDDAERAVRAGLALTGAIEQIEARLILPDGSLRIRVGVNTGEVAVRPDPGPEEGMVTGDAVNVAARLQARAPPGGVVVGEATALAVADVVELKPLGPLSLRGKAVGVPAWAAHAVLPERSRDRAMGSLRAPILGRERELGLLAQAVERVGQGASERWLLVAPPGVGKTRLLDEFADSVGARGVRVWRARLRPDVVTPYQPVAQLAVAALDGAGASLSGVDGVEERRRKARALLLERLAASGTAPARAEVVANETVSVIWPNETAQPDALGGGSDRQARFGAWLEGMDGLARGHTVTLWLVEDLHWAGGDFLAFLDLAAASPGRRFVLTTTRPSLLDRAESWCADEPREGRRTLHLPHLSDAHASELVRALVGDALKPDLVDRIVDASDGNPLFIEELLRTWVSVGLLVHDGRAWRLAASGADVHVPATVQSIYTAQIDDLPTVARQAARRASVAGRRFAVAALEPLEVRDGAKALDVLRRRALVSGPESEPYAGPTYSYRHALLRDAGYASLARAERARLHLRLARWIESLATDHAAAVAEVVAGHFMAALESTPALAHDVGDGMGREEVARLAAAWFERAGEAALAVAAHEAARALLRRAIELTRDGDALDLARRWERLGDATTFTADMQEGSRMLKQAIGLYREVMKDRGGDEERAVARAGLARTTASLGWALDQQLEFHEALSVANATLDEIGPPEDAATGTLLLLRAVQTMNSTDIRDEPEADLRRVLDIARAVGDRGLELDAAERLVAVRTERQEKDVGGEWERVYELSLHEGRWSHAVGALQTQAAILTDDHASEAWPLLDRACELAEAHGLTERLAWVNYERVEAGLVSGHWERALEAALAAIDLGERYGYHRPVVRTWFTVLPIAVARRMDPLVERAFGWFEDHNPVASSAWQLMMVAAAYLRFTDVGFVPPFVPDPEPRLPAFSEAQGDPSWFAAVERVALSWLDDGRLETVRAAVDAMATSPRPSSLAHGVERLLRGRLLAAQGADVEAAATLRAALKAFRVISAPWWIQKTIDVLAVAGDPSADDLAEADRIRDELRLEV